MRPSDDAFGRPRAAASTSGDNDRDTPSAFHLPSGPQMNLFFADESSIGDSSNMAPPPHYHHHRPGAPFPRGGGNRRGQGAETAYSDLPKPHRPSFLPSYHPRDLDHKRDRETASSGPPSSAGSPGNSNFSSPGATPLAAEGAKYYPEELSKTASPSSPSPPSSPSQPPSFHIPSFASMANTSPTSAPSGNTQIHPSYLSPFQPATPTIYSLSTTPSGPASVALSSTSSSRRNSLTGSLTEDQLQDILFLPTSHAPSVADGISIVDGAIRDDEIDMEKVIKESSMLQDEGDGAPQVENQEQQQQGDGAETNDSSMMTSSSGIGNSVPQLIMPSIKMPSRRPFTEEGKAMGRLKVLIAGDSGVGKTSLVKAIVQICEHIVHVDPITASTSARNSLVMGRSGGLGIAGGVTMGPPRPRTGSGGASGSRRHSTKSEESGGTKHISEIYASTKPYPEWWSEIDDFRVLKRRKSLGDAVLDRNVCFVDTPGYGSGSSAMDTITPVAQYIESQLQRMSSNALADGDMLNLLGGEGGVQVDVVFYLVSNRLRAVDMEYLRRLAPLTNIMILLAQADLMSQDQIAASKEQIHAQLKEANISLFSFSVLPSSSPSQSPPLPAPRQQQQQGLYAISSATGSDHENMDASVLMSPDYVQPLSRSELESLVGKVFSPNGASWLRHAAARKYLQWRRNYINSGTYGSRMPLSGGNVSELNNQQMRLQILQQQQQRHLDHLRQHPAREINTSSPAAGLGPADISTSQVLTPPMGATGSYALARITDHTQREERLAQVRLANWAADLQRSLARERERYETLARSERAVWLTERIGECVADGTIVAISKKTKCRRDAKQEEATVLTDGGDPEKSIVGFSSGNNGSRRKRQRGTAAHTPTTAADSNDGRQQQQKQQRKRHQPHQDPLGLLEVAAGLRHRGLVALEVIGSLGLLGGIALWVARQFSSPADLTGGGGSGGGAGDQPVMVMGICEWLVGGWRKVDEFMDTMV